MKKDEEKAKSDFRTLKQNKILIKKHAKKKAKRHVKVKNEPVFDKFLNSFHDDYGKIVVSGSSMEILKKVMEDDF